MSQSAPDQLKLIDVRAPLLRVMLLVPVALALVGCWYAARWYIGNVLAEFAPGVEEGRLDVARAAMRLAPNDPLTHLSVASLEKASFSPEQLREALRHYEVAVSLSPNDYRYWMELGIAREQSGDAAGGEEALRRAVELAPSYSYPRWYLGNLLLRRGRADEAFAELRRAGDADPKLRGQIFNLAWHVYERDVEVVQNAVGRTAEARAQLASYLAGRQLFDDALRLWASLRPAEQRDQSEIGEALMNTMLSAKRYHAALGLFRDIGSSDAASSVRIGQLVNAGFEDDIGTGETGPFGWQVKSIPQAQVALDTGRPHGGERSLRVLFNAPMTLEFNNISQLVAVEAGTLYRLEC
ncbi:MAG TPA: hypothetical protein VD966_11995, partial [Pyrinomonadaceae bacterium]|nr:hypothetical protein [Pyrinomonadaceae bacterium]